MALQGARFYGNAERFLFKEINVKRVGFFSRDCAITSRTCRVETESGERNRCAARDTCNECRRVRNSEPLTQKSFMPGSSHGSPSGVTQHVSHTTAPLSEDSPDGVSSRAVCIVRLP